MAIFAHLSGDRVVISPLISAGTGWQKLRNKPRDVLMPAIVGSLGYNVNQRVCGDQLRVEHHPGHTCQVINMSIQHASGSDQAVSNPDCAVRAAQAPYRKYG
jgi:hypothetical protein